MNKKWIGLIVLVVILAVSISYIMRPNNDSNTTTSSQAPDTSRPVDYSNKGLTSFPQQILNDTSITVLNLSNNNLTGSLPSQIQKLTKLEVLNVSNNLMTGIPAEVGQLSRLKILNYANNKITGLPNEIGNLTQLQILDLSGNPNVSQRDLAEIKAKLPNTQIKL